MNNAVLIIRIRTIQSDDSTDISNSALSKRQANYI